VRIIQNATARSTSGLHETRPIKGYFSGAETCAAADHFEIVMRLHVTMRPSTRKTTAVAITGTWMSAIRPSHLHVGRRQSADT
jgi:hypothetical protein